jgi:hypothetical protein
MLASVELKNCENRDDIDFFLQMKGYLPCGIISIQVYFFYQKQVPVDITEIFLKVALNTIHQTKPTEI